MTWLPVRWTLRAGILKANIGRRDDLPACSASHACVFDFHQVDIRKRQDFSSRDFSVTTKLVIYIHAQHIAFYSARLNLSP
jgi:hypothetical protein